MEFNFAKTVNVLGQDYMIEFKKPGEDYLLTGIHEQAFGVMDAMKKKIILRDRSGDSAWKKADEYCVLEWTKKTLRHEIVHAFLFESGLHKQAKACGSWAENEESVDWLAIQGPKIMKAWTEAGAM